MGTALLGDFQGVPRVGSWHGGEGPKWEEGWLWKDFGLAGGRASLGCRGCGALENIRRTPAGWLSGGGGSLS